jgi:flagellar biosynthesis protein FliQ
MKHTEDRKAGYLFVMALILTLSIFPIMASAQVNETTITFSDLNIIKGVHILIYNQTGYFIGDFETTDTTNLPSGSYVFILKPTDQSLFTSPAGTVQVLAAYLPIAINYLIAGVFIIGIAYAVSRLWK